MPHYVDGFVLPVPKKNLDAYRRMSRLGCKVWMEHGALAYRECVGDDLKSPWAASYRKQLGCKPSETVVFAYIVFKSRAHRDKVNAAVMKDPRLSAMMKPGEPMPFDCKRMLYGGFKTIVKD